MYGGLDPNTGKSRQLSRAIRGSVKDANALRASMLVEVEERGMGSSHTVAQLFDAVLEQLTVLGREQRTIEGYQQIAESVNEQMGKVQLRKLRATHLDRFYASLLKSGRSAARVRRYHSFIRRSLALCVPETLSSQVMRRFGIR